MRLDLLIGIGLDYLSLNNIRKLFARLPSRRIEAPRASSLPPEGGSAGAPVGAPESDPGPCCSIDGL